ncbi:MAG: hypothetical protein ACYTFA_13040 [Planctomycetota bacterium]|jgi:hypothetical protein
MGKRTSILVPAVSIFVLLFVATAHADIVVLDGGILPLDQGWDVNTTIVGPLDVTTDGTTLTLNTIGMPSLSQPVMTFYQDIGIDLSSGFALEIRLQVLAVQEPHNSFDAPIGFFGGFSPAFGSPYRGQLVYFDEDEVGWGDLTDALTLDTTNAFHDYRLEVLPNGRAFLFVDGGMALDFEGFATNGTIAFGDTTNDFGLDGAFAVQYIMVGPVCQPGAHPDCNQNGVPDFCDTDCDRNGVPDDCDIAGGADDCQPNGVPDVCELEGNDCDGNSVPDDCDLAGGAADCQPNAILDVCELATKDCQPNGIPDDCEVIPPDCYPSSPVLPDDPEHRVNKHRFISVNPQTNPTKDSVLKVEVAQMMRCQNAPTRGCATDSDCDNVCDGSADDPPDYTKKCPPYDCSTTYPPSTCIWSGPCVDLAPTFDPPLAWVVQQPIQEPVPGVCRRPGCPPYPPGRDNCCEDDDWIAYLGSTVPELTGGYTSWSDVWADLPAGALHIAGCAIVPVVTYAVYACSPGNPDVCSEPLMVATQKFPHKARPTAFPLFGDLCGGTAGSPPEVLPPDGYVSVKDLLVMLSTMINYGSTTLPQAHPTWVDLYGLGTGIPPNYCLCVSDLQAMLSFALTYNWPWATGHGGLDPQDCP